MYTSKEGNISFGNKFRKKISLHPVDPERHRETQRREESDKQKQSEILIQMNRDGKGEQFRLHAKPT